MLTMKKKTTLIVNCCLKVMPWTAQVLFNFKNCHFLYSVILPERMISCSIFPAEIHKACMMDSIINDSSTIEHETEFKLVSGCKQTETNPSPHYLHNMTAQPSLTTFHRFTWKPWHTSSWLLWKIPHCQLTLLQP